MRQTTAAPAVNSRHSLALTFACAAAIFLAAPTTGIAEDAQAPLLAETISDSTLAARERFKQARAALAVADVETFRQHKAELTNYPLFHFLEFEDHAHEFRNEEPSKASVAKLNSFESRFQDTTLIRKLTRTLQVRLAETEQWALFLGVSKSRVAAPLKCSRLRANHELGNFSGFSEAALELWVQPKKHHERCQTTLDAIEAAHTPPIKAIWERIYLAFEEDKPEFAQSVLKYLSNYQRKQINNWLNALEEPQPFIDSPALKADTQLNRRRYVDLILAWSKSDTVAAMDHWLANKDRFRFYEDRYYDTHRLLAVRGAYRRLPEAYEWLMGVPARDDDLELKEWRIRAALFNQDWIEVLKNIRRLPKEDQQEDHWAYWEARAFEQNGHQDKANDIFSQLAKLQSYHGFLSADKLGQEYAIRDEAVSASSEQVKALAENPSLIRAREFHHTGISWEARREWNTTLKDADDATIAAATQLALAWDMTSKALATVGRVKDFRRAISIRFPVLFEDMVSARATAYELDPSFVYALMRRESGFAPDAKSPVGATGLMQIMPRTAQHIAEMKGESDWRGDLTDPETSIEFGSFYLRHVLDRFDNREILAAAAYNAGPTRVKSWLPESDMPADVWIDAIPYSETRRYVRALLAYAAIYDFRLTGKPKRLRARLSNVPKKETDET